MATCTDTGSLGRIAIDEARGWEPQAGHARIADTLACSRPLATTPDPHIGHDNLAKTAGAAPAADADRRVRPADMPRPAATARGG